MTDEWSGLAALLANLIEKYASELNLDELPEPATEKINDSAREKLRIGLDKELAA